MNEPATLPALWPASTSAARARTAWAVLAIAGVGWVLRAIPLIKAGAFGYPVDYDEGVYFASSALLLKGVLPYRDFVFVHPPGLLYFLAPVASLGVLRDPSFGFAAARWLATLVGCANILVLGRLTMRWAGPVAAIVAAAVYATDPSAVPAERGPFIEPVLNLACLMLAWAWLSDGESAQTRSRAIASGVLCGVATTVKMWGALWLLACLFSRPRYRSRVDRVAFVVAAAMTFVLLAFPLAVAAPKSFLSQDILFHLLRPADGPVSWLDRLGAVFWVHSQLPKSLLVVGGLSLAHLRGRDPSRAGERFFAFAFISILLAFLFSSTYWGQYNAHLAVPESALAGYAGAALWAWALRGLTRARSTAVAAVLAAIPFLGARRAILTGLKRSPDLVAVGQFIRAGVPASARIVSFEPAWVVAGGRLPDTAEGKTVVDSYGTMLIDAASTGRRFSSATEAFRDEASQRRMREAVDASRFAIVGDRGYWEMWPQTQQWFRTCFVQRFPPAGIEGIDVWERAH